MSAARVASSSARPALTALGLGFRRVAADRGGLVFTAGFHLMVTMVLAGLWRTAAIGNGGQIVGYSATALVWYVATTEAAVVSLPFRLIDDIGGDIVAGEFETELLRPVPPLVPRLAGEIGQMLPRLGICAVTATGFALLVGGRPPNPAALILAAPALVLAATLNVTAQYGFAGATFWVRDARGPGSSTRSWSSSSVGCCSPSRSSPAGWRPRPRPSPSRPWPTPRPGWRPVISNHTSWPSRPAGWSRPWW